MFFFFWISDFPYKTALLSVRENFPREFDYRDWNHQESLRIVIRLFFQSLLDASLHLYKRVCPSVGLSFRRSVRPSVCPSVGLSVRRSVRPLVSRSVCPSVRWSSGASEWASERTNEWAQQSARAKRAVRRKWMNVQCEWTSERTSEWPSTLCVDFIGFLPNVHCAMAQFDARTKLIYMRTLIFDGRTM